MTLLACVAACAARDPAAEAPPAPSAVATRLVAELEARDVERLTRHWPQVRSLPEREYERVALPTAEDRACDAFRCEIVIDHAAGRFWIRVHGGLAGVAEYRGPRPLGSGDGA